MTPLFDNTLALVSGAGQGLGKAIALKLLDAGCRVAITDTTQANAQQAVAESGAGPDRCRAYALDVRDEAACAAVVAQVNRDFGRIGVLVNNAGISSRAKIDSGNLNTELDRLMDVNVKGLLNLTLACAEDLKAEKGAVVNLASITTIISTYASIPYGTSKGAVGQLTKFLARDLGVYGVRVNAVAPGLVRTPLTVDVMTNTARIERTIDRTLLKRIAEPDDVAGPVVFLASPLAQYLTGVILPVDGGYSAC